MLFQRGKGRTNSPIAETLELEKEFHYTGRSHGTSTHSTATRHDTYNTKNKIHKLYSYTDGEETDCFKTTDYTRGQLLQNGRATRGEGCLKRPHVGPEMESSRPWPWPRGASRTTGHVLGLGIGLGLGRRALGLVFLKCNKHISAVLLTL